MMIFSEIKGLLEYRFEEVRFNNKLLTNNWSFILENTEASENFDIHINGFTKENIFPKTALFVVLDVESSKSSESITIALDLHFAEKMLSDWVAGVSLVDLPKEIIIAACELFLKSTITKYLNDITLKIRSVCINDQSIQTEYNQEIIGCEVKFKESSSKVYFIVDACFFEAGISSSASPKNTSRDFELPLSFIIGRNRLSLQAVKTINHGDVLLFTDELISHNKCYVAVNHYPCFLASIDENQVILENYWNKNMQNENQAPLEENEVISTEANEGLNSALNDVNLDIKFEIPGKTMSLSDIQSLTSGFVFTLDENVDSQIAIIINGKKCGEGQLVKIESRMGVKVTRWR